MSVRAKGAFSSITKMHRALSRANEIGKLFGKLRMTALQAALRMNKLARRRLKKHALADIDSAVL